jgi:FkbM family methyltransferase
MPRGAVRPNVNLSIHGISLLVDGSDPGGLQYDSRPSFEMAVDYLYDQIAECLDPSLVLDIGANYGFTANVFAKYFPKAQLVLVEPSPRLQPYIHMNLKKNGVERYDLIGGICSDVASSAVEFALNPSGSQDNRVRGENESWTKVKVPAVTISNILKERCDGGNVFIKIDTQGFESQVFRGGMDYLSQQKNWMIMTEFAPYWLKSQGNSPEELLEFLVGNFIVVEQPVRTRFRGDVLMKLFRDPLVKEDITAFTRHIVSLNKRDLGWCDLLVIPRDARYLMSACHNGHCEQENAPDGRN